MPGLFFTIGRKHPALRLVFLNIRSTNMSGKQKTDIQQDRTDSRRIEVRGARVNNLKGVSVDIPRNRLTVVTGLSGSGKSSLAFDTLYAEGQRRYVESLSSYARQFMGKMAKPDCDAVRGMPPAIAIEQKVNTRNPRSTVGTSTEINDYLRLLFARVGHTFSPKSGAEVLKHTAEDFVRAVQAYPAGTRIAIAAPLTIPPQRSLGAHAAVLLQEGFTRLVDVTAGTFLPLEDISDTTDLGNMMLLIDRLSVPEGEGDEMSRLRDSAEAAFFEGRDCATLLVWAEDGLVRTDFSTRFEADGITFVEPTESLFNFNNPNGACPRCEGFGKIMGIDESLVVPNPALSVYDDAVVCWRGEKMSLWKQEFLQVASTVGFPIHRPYADLTPEQKEFLWRGNGRFPGIDGFFRMLEENLYKIQYRVMLARYRGKTVCPDCHGHRLRPEAQYVKVGGRSITDLMAMSVESLLEWFNALTLSPTEELIAQRLLSEIRSRLSFLVDVGLGYLTLDRQSSTLSGGESQRINLATSLGSSLVGSLYILDEPSIGLHSRDTQRLIGVLKRLRDIGNTVVIVEHDEDIMRAADNIVDVGPKAGRLGGKIVYQGPLASAEAAPESYTLRYLSGQLQIPVPKQRRKWRDYIEVTNCREHNLKGLTVRFPLGVMTAVTGVSGSGKSTLVRDILYRALSRHFGNNADKPGTFTELRGDLGRLTAVEFIDQNPIGKSSRSNPATYLKAYDEIRRLFADQQGSKQMGFTPAYFSFNTEGGRCEACKGEGTVTIEMQFMADIVMPCEVCHGQRFKREVLEVNYRGKNISDVLNMTVDQAIAFFAEDSANTTAQRIVSRLRPLSDVGLGYIKLGQSSSTLSGGENQRVKLAAYLLGEQHKPTLFIFDEPTTGLHFHDISTLLDSFNRLIAKGHSIIVVEHNIDVIKSSDYVIDLGPEGGDAGGNVVVCGTPEQVAACQESFTGQHLKNKLIN